jgi:NADH-ubiquinone oxidoreductase chain 1
LLLLVSWLVQCLLIILRIAFFTLFERKVIGLFHIRLGPNKTAFLGLFQPLLDAFKLLTKQTLTPLRSRKIIYSSSPFLALLLSLFLWTTLPLFYYRLSYSLSVVVFLCVGSLMVFPVILSGWASNSKYSLIGSMRSVAQSISYESVFSTLIVFIMVLLSSYSVESFRVQSSVILIGFLPLWFICTLAETHRAPFDFSESESELVSGFNTEYSGVNFALLFLSEYGVILYSCILMVYLFFCWILPGYYLFYVVRALRLSFLFVWVRITFCRFRYDKLMDISWKVLLPTCLRFFVTCVILL